MLYAVIGVYDDNGQIFCDHVEATNPATAFATVAKNTDEKECAFVAVVELPAKIEFPGEFTVSAETVLEQPNVFPPDTSCQDIIGPIRHNATDAVGCLIEDFNSYLDGTVDPDRESHQCSLDNALMLEHLLGDVRSLGAAIEEGDPQTVGDRWLLLKRRVEA